MYTWNLPLIRFCTNIVVVKIFKSCKYLGIEMCHNLKGCEHIKIPTIKLGKIMYYFKI